MGNMRRLKDNEDFGASHFAAEKDFGFTGSSEGYDEHPVAPPFAGSRPSSGPHTSRETTPQFAKGGAMHPHGHKVIRAEHQHDGSVIMHHAHGGFTTCHADGGMTHHGADGEHIMAQGGYARGGHHHDSSEFAHRHRGMKEGSAEEEATESPSFEAKEDGMARGGHRRPHMPPGVHKPRMASEHSPINSAPRNPMRTPTMRNQMPAGEMGMGVEPSAEPDVAGADQAGAPFRRGGHARKRHHEG